MLKHPFHCIHFDPFVIEPTFISMEHVPESVDSEEGDDDKVYLFFSENAMEYDFYSKLTVSRVARVCKVRRITQTPSHTPPHRRPMSGCQVFIVLFQVTGVFIWECITNIGFTVLYLHDYLMTLQ